MPVPVDTRGMKGVLLSLIILLVGATACNEGRTGRGGASGLLDVDIVQVGNHGAADGITEGLLKAMSPEVAVLSMGAAWRHGEWTAADHGHPRRDVVELLAKGVSGKRPVTTVRVFEGEDTPYDKVALKKAVYGTGWDRTVVMDVTPKGDVSVVWPGK